MITATQKVLNEIISPVRDIHARVELYEGSTLVEICNCNDRLIQFNVERIGDESKFFGFGICQRINAHFIDKNRTLNISTANTMKVAYRVGEDELVYPYPTFHVSEVKRDENTNELSITGYDLMYPDSAHLVSDMTLPESYSLFYFASAASNALKASGVAIANGTDSSDFMLNLPKGGNFEGSETIREALNDVAEATQTIYYINNQDQLTFKRLDKNSEPDLIISKSDYITLESRTNRRLAKIYHTTELGDNLHAETEATGSTQYIRENCFWTMLTSSEIASLLDKAILSMGGITINQFDCSWRGNFLLEIGDKIGLVTKDEGMVYAYVIDDTVVYNGAFSETTGWSYTNNDDETPSNPTTLGDKLNQTFARVDKINKEIELLVSDMESIDVDGIKTLQTDVSRLRIDLTTIAQEVRSNKTTIDGDITKIEEDIASLVLTNDSITQRVSALEQSGDNDEEVQQLKEEVAELKITTQGITQEVSRVEQETGESIRTLTEAVSSSVSAEDVKILIKQEITEGIDVDAQSVTTTTGYVFNKEGLTVSKTGSDITTQITEDGMTVRRNSETVLSADSDGVYATNLHATTYLIIGETSRFEDYDGDTGLRTGCFWTGR